VNGGFLRGNSRFETVARKAKVKNGTTV